MTGARLHRSKLVRTYDFTLEATQLSIDTSIQSSHVSVEINSFLPIFFCERDDCTMVEICRSLTGTMVGVDNNGVVKILSCFRFLMMNNDDKPVGMLCLRVHDTGVPFRVYFPAACSSKNRAPWFHETFPHYIFGYCQVLLPRYIGDWPWLQYIVANLIWIFSWLIPTAYSIVPNLYIGAPPAAGSFPIVFHSHGLTGTGSEHSLLLTKWAQSGYIVVAPTHTDGSSSSVSLSDGRRMYYVHPDYKNYDTSFRLKQVEHREADFYSTIKFVLMDDSFPASIRSKIDDRHVND